MHANDIRYADLFDRDTCLTCHAPDAPVFEGRCQSCLSDDQTDPTAHLRACHPSDGLYDALDELHTDLMTAGLFAAMDARDPRPELLRDLLDTAVVRLSLILLGLSREGAAA